MLIARVDQIRILFFGTPGIVLVLVRKARKSETYFDLSYFNWNFNHSDICYTLGISSFQKWELFSGSPGSINIFCEME